MTKAEFESAVWTLVGLHKRGGLSEPGLVDAVVILAVEFAAGDGPEVTAARRKVLAQHKRGAVVALASAEPAASPDIAGAGIGGVTCG